MDVTGYFVYEVSIFINQYNKIYLPFEFNMALNVGNTKVNNISFLH